MADRAPKTRQKTTDRLASSKPRNPLVVPARRCAAGPHRKSRAAERVGAREALQRALKSEDDDR